MKLNSELESNYKLIEIDRVKKVNVDNKQEYTVTFYMLNHKKTNKNNEFVKVYTKLTKECDKIRIHEIKMTHSLEYVLPRVPFSGRGSTLLKTEIPQGFKPMMKPFRF